MYVTTSVPQKANAVLVEPVLLLMARVNVLVWVVPAVQELHALPPVKVALTNSRSFEVHELKGGKVVVVCDQAVETKIIAGKKTAIKIFQEITNLVRILNFAKGEMRSKPPCNEDFIIVSLW